MIRRTRCSDLALPVDAHAATDPPHNSPSVHAEGKRSCGHTGASCTKLGQSLRSTGRLSTQDFALVPAEQGPSRIAQLVGMYSGDPIWVGYSCFGVCQISPTCYHPTTSGTKHVFLTSFVARIPQGWKTGTYNPPLFLPKNRC